MTMMRVLHNRRSKRPVQNLEMLSPTKMMIFSTKLLRKSNLRKKTDGERVKM